MTDPKINNKDLLGKLNDIFDDPLADDWEQKSEAYLQSNSLIQERFKDKELIASGGMKNIFKVFDTKTNRYIALAELRYDVPEEQSELFLKEAYLTAALEHPNIISIYDVGSTERNFPYFTMELKIGDSLEKILRLKSSKKESYCRKYDLDKLLNIYLKVCDAVSYAHSQNILHLDIKPDNIQVGQFGEVQLCDWGLGSNLEELNSDDTIKGTPGYMSPEQFSPEKEKSFGVDIYALGALLYTILSGEHPSKGGLNTIIKKTVTGDIIFPKERFPELNIPQSLNAVVERAMALDSEERYLSVKELAKEVEKFLSGRSTEAENAGFIKEAQLFIKRNKQISLVTLIAILVINIGGAIAIYEINKSKNKTEAAYEELQKSHEKVIKMTYKDASLKLMRPAFFTTHTIKYMKTAIQSFHTLLEMDKNPDSKKQLVKALIIAQKYSDAALYSDPSSNDYYELVQRFKNYQKPDGQSISDLELLEVLKYINLKMDKPTRINLTERILVYHLAKDRRILSPPDLVREVLASWNPGWDKSKFKYFKSNHTLKLSGIAFSTLRADGPEVSKQSILRFMKIDRLNLSHSNFQDLLHLKGLDINYLDISNTNVKSLKHLPLLMKLERLIINRDQFPTKELAKFKTLKIEFVD